MYEDVEADDIIAAITQSKALEDWHKVILSNDKDFMQLCDDKTILCRPAKKPWEILNTNRIVEDLSVHPVNMALARAIVGDKSDNLPGVPNIGFGRVNKFLNYLQKKVDDTYHHQIFFHYVNAQGPYVHFAYDTNINK